MEKRTIGQLNWIPYFFAPVFCKVNIYCDKHWRLSVRITSNISISLCLLIICLQDSYYQMEDNVFLPFIGLCAPLLEELMCYQKQLWHIFTGMCNFVGGWYKFSLLPIFGPILFCIREYNFSANIEHCFRQVEIFLSGAHHFSWRLVQRYQKYEYVVDRSCTTTLPVVLVNGSCPLTNIQLRWNSKRKNKVQWCSFSKFHFKATTNLLFPRYVYNVFPISSCQFSKCHNTKVTI